MDVVAIVTAFLNMIAEVIRHDTAMMDGMTPDQRIRYSEVVVKDRERLYTIGTLMFGWIDKLVPGSSKALSDSKAPSDSLIPRG